MVICWGYDGDMLRGVCCHQCMAIRFCWFCVKHGPEFILSSSEFHLYFISIPIMIPSWDFTHQDVMNVSRIAVVSPSSMPTQSRQGVFMSDFEIILNR